MSFADLTAENARLRAEVAAIRGSLGGIVADLESFQLSGKTHHASVALTRARLSAAIAPATGIHPTRSILDLAGLPLEFVEAARRAARRGEDPVALAHYSDAARVAEVLHDATHARRPHEVKDPLAGSNRPDEAAEILPCPFCGGVGSPTAFGPKSSREDGARCVNTACVIHGFQFSRKQWNARNYHRPRSIAQELEDLADE